MTKHTQNPPFSKPNRALAQSIHARAAIILIAIGSSISTPFAQQAPEQTLRPIIITAPTAREQLSIGGLELPLREAPVSATVISSEQIKESGAQRLADLFKLDASISDAYNAVGYIDYATVRGFVIDNKYNIRRDGLPISGDTAIGLANKDRVEILKGTSGIQAGTSAPGGLVNYIIKRPTAKPLRTLDFSVDSNGQLGAAIDLGGRFGETNAQGYRLNFAADRLNSAAPGTRGSRQQLGLALDSRVGRDGLLEAEFEWSRQSQRNVPGLSVLGSTGALPDADPKLNLNRQAWSQPTQFEGLTGSLRYTQAINDQWQWSAHLGSQRLKTDDRIAFPFGFECYAPNFTYCDRFNDNGDVDLYDFRSEGEHRSKLAAQFKLEGNVTTGAVQHNLSIGLLRATSRITMPDSAYNYAGTVNLSNPSMPVQASPTLTQLGNQLRETSSEFFATDMIAWNDSFKTWLGLRHTRLSRSDASNGILYQKNFTTPWLAASYQIGAHTLYASHGQGIESEVVASINTVNPSQVLPLRRSRQTEIGIKYSADKSSWQATIFDITRPMSSIDSCSLAGISPCNVQADGSAKHAGIEISAQKNFSNWSLNGSATWLRAQRNGSSVAQINGLNPTNVPSHILRVNAAYRFAPDWQAGLHISHEGKRQILPDNSLQLPAWTRLDASVQWQGKAAGIASLWQLSINNLLGKRYFQESPHQFGHAYLFPAQPRTLRLAVSMAL